MWYGTTSQATPATLSTSISMAIYYVNSIVVRSARRSTASLRGWATLSRNVLIYSNPLITYLRKTHIKSGREVQIQRITLEHACVINETRHWFCGKVHVVIWFLLPHQWLDVAAYSMGQGCFATLVSSSRSRLDFGMCSIIDRWCRHMDPVGKHVDKAYWRILKGWQPK